MRWYYGTSFALAVAAANLAACGGSGGSPQPGPAAARGTAAPAATVRATIVIPARAESRTAKRGRAYVSPSTAGLIVTVHDSNGTASFGYDLEPSAPGCSVSSGDTVCTLTLVAATGSDTFDAYLYDRSEGTANPTALGTGFSAAGNLLSEEQGAGAAIEADSANAITLTLGAVAKTVSLSPAVVSVSGSGGATVPLLLQTYDAGGNPIPTDGSDGGYFNLAVAAFSDGHLTFGGSRTILFDGAPSLQPASATASPYSGTFGASVSLTNAGYGAAASYPTASASTEIAPLFLYAPATSLQAGQTVTLVALAAATPSGAAYAIAKTADSSSNNCDPFTISSAAPSAPQVAAYAIGATAASPQTNGSPVPCVFAVSDGTGTATDSKPFVSGSTSVIIVIPSPVPSATPSR